MDTIFCLSNNDVITKKLQHHIENQGLNFELINVTEVPANMEYFIVVEPFKVQGQSYGIHGIWKNYLSQEKGNKNTKLIVAGFNFKYQNTCKNYLDLAAVPHDLKSMLAASRTLDSGWELEEEEHNLRSRLKQFLKGHGNQSLFLKLNYLRMEIVNTLESINGNIGRTYEDACTIMIPASQKHWKEFLGRWESYKIYFECTPFHKVKLEVEKLITEIQPFFDIDVPTQSEFLSYPCLVVIENIRNEFEKMDKYVQPEN